MTRRLPDLVLSRARRHSRLPALQVLVPDLDLVLAWLVGLGSGGHTPRGPLELLACGERLGTRLLPLGELRGDLVRGGGLVGELHAAAPVVHGVRLADVGPHVLGAEQLLVVAERTRAGGTSRRPAHGRRCLGQLHPQEHRFRLRRRGRARCVRRCPDRIGPAKGALSAGLDRPHGGGGEGHSVPRRIVDFDFELDDAALSDVLLAEFAAFQDDGELISLDRHRVLRHMEARNRIALPHLRQDVLVRPCPYVDARFLEGRAVLGPSGEGDRPIGVDRNGFGGGRPRAFLRTGAFRCRVGFRAHGGCRGCDGGQRHRTGQCGAHPSPSGQSPGGPH